MDPSSINRRTNPKSKSGCKTCKRRKVKCGEERPECKNCIKHAVKCDFLLSASPHFSESSPHSSLSSPKSSIDNDRSHGIVEPLAMQDLELFHNWCFSTFSTITNDLDLQEVWRNQATQLAFSHSFVMRTILAVSALHVATLRPERQRHYMLLAMKHHHEALTTARLLLADVKPADAPALWMFTALTLVFKMGSPNSATELISPDADGLFQWVYLLRGVQTVMQVGTHELKTSAVRPLFERSAMKSLWRKSSTSQEVHLLQLLERIEATDHPLKETFLSVTEQLRQMYAGASGISTGSYSFTAGPHEMTDAFIWPFHLPDSYINALQQKSPEALTILAHYCVLLKVWHQKCWWLHGCSDQLMSVIWASLDVEHRRWIQWPILETEWLPT